MTETKEKQSEQFKESLRAIIKEMKLYDDEMQALKSKKAKLQEKSDKIIQQQEDAFSYKREDEKLALERELEPLDNKLEAHKKAYYSEKNKDMRLEVYDRAYKYMRAVIDEDEAIQQAITKAEQATVQLLKADDDYRDRHNQLRGKLVNEVLNTLGYESMNEEPSGYQDRFIFNALDRKSQLSTIRHQLEYYLRKLRGEAQ